MGSRDGEKRIGARVLQTAGRVRIAAGVARLAWPAGVPGASGHLALAWGLPAAALVAGAVLTRMPSLYDSRLLLQLGDASH